MCKSRGKGLGWRAEDWRWRWRGSTQGIENYLMPCLRVLQGVSCTLFPTGTQTIRNRSSNAVAEVCRHRSWKVTKSSLPQLWCVDHREIRNMMAGRRREEDRAPIVHRSSRTILFCFCHPTHPADTTELASVFEVGYKLSIACT